MPYIKQEMRVDYDNILNEVKTIPTKGELEYCIYKLMKIYMTNKEFRYSNLHDVVYAVQHCCDEFRRNYLDKRENLARKLNGRISPSLEVDEG